MEKVKEAFVHPTNSVSIDQTSNILQVTQEYFDSYILEQKDRTIARLKSQLSRQSLKLRMAEIKLEKIQNIVKSARNFDKEIDELRKVVEDLELVPAIFPRTNYKDDQEFICTLKRDFPKLTSNDLRICTLLRYNLSTKEVAQHLAIGPGSVNKARYRIRMKLNLSKGEGLIHFLLSY